MNCRIRQRFRGLFFPLFWFIDSPFSWFSLCFPNFDIVVANYTDDRSLEVGSDTSELVLCYGNVSTRIGNVFMVPRILSSSSLFCGTHYNTSFELESDWRTAWNLKKWKFFAKETYTTSCLRKMTTNDFQMPSLFKKMVFWQGFSLAAN